VIASCRVHSIDPQQYLDEVLRVLPYWPKERYLELAPKSWKATRAKLRSDELDAPLCSFTIPEA
jgi:transposase